LLLPYSLPAAVAAIALASITTRTDGEKRAAGGVKTLPHAKALSRSICCHGAGHSPHNTPGMIGQMTAPSAPMMLLPSARSSEDYVFRSLLSKTGLTFL
jgi:hypothetical protein